MRRLILATLFLCPLLTLAADRQIVNVGPSAGDNTGDTPRVAFQKMNANDAELFSRTAALTNVSTVGGYAMAYAVTNPAAFRQALGASKPIRAAWYGTTATKLQEAIDAAAAAGGGDVVVDQGTYSMSHGLTLSNNVNLLCEGQAVLDFSGATITNACIYGTGSLTELAALSGNVSAGATSISLASAPSLLAGDVVVLWCSDTFSYSSYRNVYYKGEYAVVSAVSGADLTLSTAIYGDYASASTHVYKLVPIKTKVSGFRIIAKNGAQVAGIKLTLGRGSQLSDLHITGSEYAQICLDRNFQTELRGIRTFDGSPLAGINYGVFVGNSQQISISDCFLSAARHGLSFGGGDLTGAVPCRQITVSGGTVASAGNVYGMNFHGNCERALITGVMLPNGIETGGDHFTLENCEVGNLNSNGYAITEGAESIGANVTLANNRVYAVRNFNEGLVVYTLRNTTADGSAFKVVNNSVFAGPYKRADYPTNATDVVRLMQLASAETNVWVDISGNTVTTTLTTAGEYNGIRVYLASAAAGLRAANVSGNTLANCGIRVDGNVSNLTLHGNKVFDSLTRGINLAFVSGPAMTKQVVDLQGNFVANCHGAGIHITPDSLGYVTVRNNTALDNARTLVSGTGDAAVYIGQGSIGIVEDNVLGGLSTSTNLAYALGTTVGIHRNNAKIGWTSTYVGSGTDIGTVTNGVNWTDGAHGTRSTAGLRWDNTTGTLAIGSASGGIEDYKLRVVENLANVLHMQLSNESTHTNATARFDIGNGASGYLQAAHSAHWNDKVANKVVLAANSSATNGISLQAETAGQEVSVYTSLGKVLSLDSNATADQTPLYLWDSGAAALKRVLVDTNRFLKLAN